MKNFKNFVNSLQENDLQENNKTMEYHYEKLYNTIEEELINGESIDVIENELKKIKDRKSLTNLANCKKSLKAAINYLDKIPY